MRFILFILLSVISVAHAQIPSAGIPKSAQIINLKSLSFVEMPAFNITEEKEKNRENSFKALKFGKNFEVNYNTQNSGKWHYLDDGSKIWILNIRSAGALSMNVIFTKFHLPKGANLYVYNKTKNVVLGAFTHKNNKPWKELPVAPVPGDEITIELDVPANAGFEPELEIGQVTHDYLGIYGILKVGEPGSSGDCNVDINCYNNKGYQTLKNAVCRVLANGNELCTGTLVNNPSDAGMPYLLTANHCMETDKAARRSVFFFNYERVFCNGPLGSLTKTLSGAELVATKVMLDFSMVKLSVKPPFGYNPYYAGWNIETDNITSTYTIHHPAGDVKKISFDHDPPVVGTFRMDFEQDAFWHILEWDIGTTEAGSSGGPLFDQNHRLIGGLSGGYATCQINKNDFYYMLSKVWDTYPQKEESLKSWLDPQNAEIITTEGKDPYANFRKKLTFLDNYNSDETLVLTSDINWGYTTGHGNHGFAQFAERVFITGTTNIVGMDINVAKNSAVSEFPLIRVKVWENSLEEKNVILQKDIGLTNISAGQNNYIGFDKTIMARGILYYGFQLYYPGIADTFALYHTEKKHYTTGFLVCDQNNKWHAVGDLFPELDNTHLSMSLVVSDDLNTGVDQSLLQNKVEVYPNPAINEIKVSAKSIIQSFSLLDLHGRLLIHENNPRAVSTLTIDVTFLQTGSYILHVNTRNGSDVQKIVLIK